MASSSFDRAARTIARRVRERRTELKLTQESVAERAGLNARHYQKIEAGKLNLTLETLCAVADALKTSLRELVG